MANRATKRLSARTLSSATERKAIASVDVDAFLWTKSVSSQYERVMEGRMSWIAAVGKHSRPNACHGRVNPTRAQQKHQHTHTHKHTNTHTCTPTHSDSSSIMVLLVKPTHTDVDYGLSCVSPPAKQKGSSPWWLALSCLSVCIDTHSQREAMHNQRGHMQKAAWHDPNPL